MDNSVDQAPVLVTGGSGYLAGFTLTTILPGFVQGPALEPAVSGSLELPLRMLTGRLPLVPRVSFCGVDTRDAAELHVKALTDDRARGQRIIAAGAPLSSGRWSRHPNNVWARGPRKYPRARPLTG